MKKLKLILFAMISLLLTPTIVNAASGKISVSGGSTVVTGNKVTVTVTLSSSSALGSWQMDLNYDKNYLQLVSSTAEGSGTRMVGYADNSNTKSKTYTFSFRALKSGTTRVSVSSYLAYDFESMGEMSLTASSKSIRIMTQEELEATYSKDNNLKNLSVDGYQLDKEFNKDTLEYSVTVPTGTTSVKINATKNDSTASISGDGEVTVTEGVNKLPIVVTAQNGSEKTYTLIVNVEDQNPINVTVNNDTYTVVKNASLLTAPTTFSETKVTINNFEIPAFVNNISDITLVGLKDSLGNISLFIYNDNQYQKYNEMNLKSNLLLPVPFEKELDLIKTTVKINNEEVEAYKYSENTEMVIINAKNLEDGTTALYLYDTKNHTAQRYDESFVNETNETIKNYTYVIIAFAGALFLMLLLIFSLLHSLKKKQKKINKFIEKQEAKIEATRKLNDVVAEVKKITEENKPKEETKEQIKEEEDSKPQNLSKKERKKLAKEQKKLEQEKDNAIEVKEIQVKKEKLTEKEAQIIKQDLEQTEEMYDLFEDEKKKKKKK